MKYTNLNSDNTLTMSAVHETLTKKVNRLETLLYDMHRGLIHKDDTADDLIHDAQLTLFEIKCLTEMVTDEKMKSFSCANKILSYMQKDTYYDRREMILTMEDEGCFIGNVNSSLRVLESSGIVGRRTIDGIETVYLFDKPHAWIIEEVDHE